MAHFEAQTIKESIEREEGAGYVNRLVEPQRKRIARSSAAVRSKQLIPLICVEEGRIRKLAAEAEAAGKIEERTEERVETFNEERQVTEDVQEDMVADTTPNDGVKASVLSDVRRDSHSRNVSTANGPTSTSSWSWWGRQAQAREQHTQVTATDITTPDNPKEIVLDVQSINSHSRNLSSTSAATTLTSSGWSWLGRSAASTPASTPKQEPKASVSAADLPAIGRRKRISGLSFGVNRPASPKVDVARDGFGRSLKGMNRIMGWDGGGGSTST